MYLTKDALEEWALHCEAKGATISLDSSGAPAPYHEEWWKKLDVADENNETENEEILKAALSEVYGVEKERIALTAGAQHADFLFFLTQMRHDDLVAVENPTFIPLRHQAEMVCHSTTLRRDPDRNFMVDAGDLEQVLTDGARAVALTNLHNPSASQMEDDELAWIVDSCQKKGAMVLVDEVYREMSYGYPTKAAFEMGENGVSVSSLTKLNGLRGLRIGWLIGPEKVAQEVEMARIYSSYRLPSRNLALAAAAVRRQSWFRERVLRKARTNLPIIYDWLQEEERISCSMPDGALMALFELPQGVDDLKLSERILDQSVAVGPGRYFGAPGCIRVTFSCSQKELAEGLNAVTRALDTIP
jgi:aspartate/methionine/tyrosine aminotransferase